MDPPFLLGFPFPFPMRCLFRVCDAFPVNATAMTSEPFRNGNVFFQERNQQARDLDPLRPGWLVGKHVCPAVPCSHTHARTHKSTHRSTKGPFPTTSPLSLSFFHRICLSDRFLHERSRRSRRRKTGSEWAKTMTICVSKQSTSEIAPALLFFLSCKAGPRDPKRPRS
jgi:hypothetical protein